MPSKVGAVIAALVFAIALLVGILIVGAVYDAATDQPRITEYEEYDAARLQGTNTFVKLNDGSGFNETVWKTTGFAVNLTGASDSFVESRESVDIADDDTWSVSTWARVDGGAEEENMTAISVDGRVLIQYLNGTWSAWYYDEGSRTSWRANVSATEQPGNFTLVTATSNGTYLWIYANNTQGDVVNITGSNVEDSTFNTTNWDGRLEETRTFDDPTNDSKQNTLYNNPIAERSDRNRTTRVMWDQPGRPQVLLFTSTVMETSNATFSDGFAAQEMQPDSLVGGDYEWDETGPRIRPVAGGDLDPFPVAYASYSFESALASQVKGIADAFNLAAIIPIVIVAGIILGVVSKYG